MSVYEDDDYIDQLADEAVDEDQHRQAAIEFIHQSIELLPDPHTKIIFRMMMCVITKNY